MTGPRHHDPLWFKDAIIYELHVRSFFDSNDDGIGDFQGLIRKLDYLEDLGVNCLWLLPFYPSPLRDDGYDIANYRDIHPSYGTLRDFRQFLREAHARNLRVFTELVVNHTSDQHPWFQAARRAPKGSARRDYYVWSDTGQEYSKARIIFTDTETSNWTWDPVAGAYFWHRFFAHQPDLNFDNPSVLKAVTRVMKYWLDMGVDGLRLDAIPYLIEREGTNCENLAETHVILKHLRRELDASFESRALLAEANQWPADVRPYFGDGDECHMAYHFPLMPRIFMAVRQEDAHPIIEIMRQTPEIPENCQWALFLRNHDELTLEMVTDEERDYMYSAYAADPQMRINVGIRRRLAPLMEHSRARIELLNSLLLSLPGSPIIYYGDELGMGDNVYLGDRNGVRTPMQWTGDRNAGFSRADPARLFAPPVMDPLYGYQAINVEAQERSPSSLLNWMRRLIALRKRYQTFGRGSLEFVPTDNRRILAYVRADAEHQILVVANMARTVQPVHLDLGRFRGLHPIEMIGNADLPPVGADPYFLTIGPHGFYWFLMAHASEPIVVSRPKPAATTAAPQPALLVSAVWEGLLDSHARRVIERDALIAFVTRQRWFASKGRRVTGATFVDWATLRTTPVPLFLTLVEVAFETGASERYMVPIATAVGDQATQVAAEHPNAVLARISGARAGLLFDAMVDPGVSVEIVELLRRGQPVPFRHGALRIGHAVGGAALLEPSLEGLRATIPSLEQSNSNALVGDRFLLKVFRRLEPGENPDIEIGRTLGARSADAHVPALVAWAEHVPASGAASCSVAMLQQQVTSRGSSWERALDQLSQYYEAIQVRLRGGGLDPGGAAASVLVEEASGAYWTTIFLLGRRTAELHKTLASLTGEGFDTRAITPAALAASVEAMRARADTVLDQLSDQVGPFTGLREIKACRLLELRPRVLDALARLGRVTSAGRAIRAHGDFHLGQVLEVDGDVFFIDFEGEPARPITERRVLQSPLRDVAGMLRSLGYAAVAGLRQFRTARPDVGDTFARWATAWQDAMSEVFLRGYFTTMGAAAVLPDSEDDRRRLLDLFVLDKAIYELGYELGNRPDWVDIPLDALLRLVDPQWVPPAPARGADAGHA
ncbi:MAG: maltose alpha-D-glucosyltransferase [Acidobacteriota bacterium]